MNGFKTRKSALAFGGSDGAAAAVLALELGRLGGEPQRWPLADDVSLAERLAAEGDGLSTLLLGLSPAALEAGWLRRFVAAGPPRPAGPAPSLGVVCFAACEPPAELASSPRFDFSQPRTEVTPLLEQLEPRAGLVAALDAVRARWWGHHRSLAASARNQDWPRLWSELAELLALGLEIRYRLELRRPPGHGEPGLLTRYPGFEPAGHTARPADARPLEWSWFPELCSLAVHDLRNELAVLPLLAERLGSPDAGPELTADIAGTLARLAAMFDRVLDLRG